jgi:UDP-2,4-diacetamido-2,4,6-trideoxy-beta-L-altropyranose hydrolase
MKILFRTSGGTSNQQELGTGHIFRCINLAKQFKKSNIFFLVEDFGGIKEIFEKNNFKNIIFLKPQLSKKNDIKKTLKEVKKEKIDIVIVDKLGINKSYLTEIRKNISTVYIADLLEYEFSADLIINGFLGFKNSRIKNKYGSTCLLGPKYQILSNSHIQKKMKKPKFDLLITLGGYDKNQNLDKLALILPNFLSKLKIKIIIGPSTKKSKKIQQLENQFKNSLTVIKFSKNIRTDIANTKFGLCGGGITTYEFGLLKIPFFIICQYEHQNISAKYWKKFGYSEGYIEPKNKTMNKVEKYFQSIINKKIIAKRKKIEIDNLAILRIKKELYKLKIT